MAKRILIYTNHFYPEHFKINEIVQWISSKESHIRVVTGIPNYPSGKIIKGYSNIFNDNVIINRLFLIPRGNGSNFRLLINYITYFISCFWFSLYLAIFKKKYDVIFVHHTSPFFIAIHPLTYSIFHNSKKILWDLDIWPESLKAVDAIRSNIMSFFVKIIVTWVYSKYQLILVGSKTIKSLISKRYDGKIIYYPNWADIQIEKNQKDINFGLQLNSNKFNIVYTGNIGKAQGFINLIKTIKLVDENIHWTFVGDGRFKEEFKSLIHKHSLTEKTTFVDQVEIDKIPTIVDKASALFLSLKNEKIFSMTVPAKLQTYMALGKPIIGVLSGEGANIIKESRSGLTEENYDYKELANKINNFANKSELELYEMGKNAMNFYQKKYNSDIRKKQILEIIYE